MGVVGGCKGVYEWDVDRVQWVGCRKGVVGWV